MLKLGIRPRQIMTKEAFENAIAVVMALGGSTNAVLHLLAIANEARVELTLDDFDRVGRRVPHIADTKPHGRYHMVDLDRVGGVPVVMRALLEAGLLHGDCLTVTGRTMAENLDDLAAPAPDGQVVRPGVAADPRRRWHRHPARTRWPRTGRSSRWPGIDQDRFEGVARVFDGEDQAMEAILAGSIQPGTVLVIRYEGPKGGPGMREMLAVTGAMKGAGRGADCALMTDGRFSGGTHGFCVGHIAPEAVDGGPIAFVADGDRIVVDVPSRRIDVLVDAGRARPPEAEWKCPEPRYRTGRAGQVRPAGHRCGAGRGHRAVDQGEAPYARAQSAWDEGGS